MLEKLILPLARSESLSDEQVRLAVDDLTGEAVPVATKVDFLSQLARKGETPAEIAAFALALRARAIQPVLDPVTRAREILDVVGTGGDGACTINISTAVALICAAAGVVVAKHGNRAATSRCGSADVLEALGVRIELPPEEAVRSLREHGFAFFFAPRYHPAFKHVAAARKLCAERGQRTIFNFLGPLVNPAQPSAMLVGVPRPDLCEPLARVLQTLGVRRAMVVCGEIGGTTSGFDGSPSNPSNPAYLDELSPFGPTTIAEFYQERALTCSSFSAEPFGLQPATLEDLRGGDREGNATSIRRIFSGEECGPKREAVLLNAAAALFVAGAAHSVAEGWDAAQATLDGGKASAKLVELGGRP